MDIGCGSGSFLLALRQQGYAPYGIEIAKAAVKELKRSGFNVAEGPLENTPKEWGDFNIVTAKKDGKYKKVEESL
ncbi:MAG: class I SAM-dependent methyltransferase [Actinomycetota bacterium]